MLSTDCDHSANFVGIKPIPGPRWKLLIPFGTRQSRARRQGAGNRGLDSSANRPRRFAGTVETTRTKQLLNTFLRRLRGLAPRGRLGNATATVEKYKAGDSQAQGRVAELAGGIILSNDRSFFVVRLLLPGRHPLALMLPGVNARRQAWC